MFSKINAWLHLWLGLFSGIVVVILSITGCLLVFQEELSNIFYPWRTVEARTAEEQLPPSEIFKAIKAYVPGKEIQSIWYHGLDRSIKVNLESDSILYVNPYTAEMLAFVDHEDFFHEIDEGHRHLWLPKEYGDPIVGWGTFIFFLLLLSGLVLWYPKKWSKSNVNKSFKIKWKASLKRINYDLHNVLGFYAMLLALIMAISGLVMSFPWARKTVYWLSGGDKVRKERRNEPKEEKPVITMEEALLLSKTDEIWNKVRKEYAIYNKEAIIIGYPDASEALYTCTDMIYGSWRYIYFDLQTMLPTKGTQTALNEEKAADWIMRANYGIHTGLIYGTTTKILYFLASLICGTLPITGFYVWWNKRKKDKSKKGKVLASKNLVVNPT
ncbi:PepSY domain-containing protein [Dyadobacter sp. CY312]|uniref:PepSY-associated TM helix domain-containing protein n=1 Tax=Dyadobacter sp. CY312 TaxID=2907303 RepID=UPI001F34A9B8|nr:PepSY-associated TM helix domain-containing protein [Dyadobacter sp. CY312]MCE7043302.1 PepSY domain-containing protein [Dyadobacter sp. CY312]